MLTHFDVQQLIKEIFLDGEGVEGNQSRFLTNLHKTPLLLLSSKWNSADEQKRKSKYFDFLFNYHEFK